MKVTKNRIAATSIALAALCFVLLLFVWPGNQFCVNGVIWFSVFGLMVYMLDISVTHHIVEEEEEENLPLELYLLAGESMQECHDCLQFTSHFMNSAEERLYLLAKNITGNDDLPREDSLKVFFTEEAIEILKKLPNAYWFWRVVSDSASYHPGKDFSTRISAEDLDHVFELYRTAVMQGFGIDLESDSWLLNDDVSSHWQAAGIILYDFDHGRVRNPIFARSADFNLTS